MRRSRSKEVLIRERRFLAIDLLKTGRTAREVAFILGVSANSVYKWKKIYEEKGWEALWDRPYHGRPAGLSEEERALLNAILTKGAKYEGYPDDKWTLPRVAEVIEKRFGIKFTKGNIKRILNQLGWRFVKDIKNPTHYKGRWVKK